MEIIPRVKILNKYQIMIMLKSVMWQYSLRTNLFYALHESNVEGQNVRMQWLVQEKSKCVYPTVYFVIVLPPKLKSFVNIDGEQKLFCIKIICNIFSNGFTCA